mmetsp:Transcript_8550/g.26529  ORF Transcript_8550/g.26529 Transcript_8550/m.26529 type:complete len:228 (+) Transcript_8550:51-734(+)
MSTRSLLGTAMLFRVASGRQRRHPHQMFALFARDLCPVSPAPPAPVPPPASPACVHLCSRSLRSFWKPEEADLFVREPPQLPVYAPTLRWLSAATPCSMNSPSCSPLEQMPDCCYDSICSPVLIRPQRLRIGRRMRPPVAHRTALRAQPRSISVVTRWRRVAIFLSSLLMRTAHSCATSLAAIVLYSVFLSGWHVSSPRPTHSPSALYWECSPQRVHTSWPYSSAPC